MPFVPPVVDALAARAPDFSCFTQVGIADGLRSRSVAHAQIGRSGGKARSNPSFSGLKSRFRLNMLKVQEAA
jgi:hypothetical protein